MYIYNQYNIKMTVSVEEYTSDDWMKLEAAVNALKSNVLDDSIELDPSVIGQFLQVRSHSTPNFTEIDYEEQQQQSSVPPANVETQPLTPEVFVEDSEVSHSLVEQSYLASGYTADTSALQSDVNGSRLTDEWVAGLPSNVRRPRALTEPIPLPMELEAVPHRSSDRGIKRNVSVDESASDRRLMLTKKQSISPRHLSIQEDQTLNLSMDSIYIYTIIYTLHALYIFPTALVQLLRTV